MNVNGRGRGGGVRQVGRDPLEARPAPVTTRPPLPGKVEEGGKQLDALIIIIFFFIKANSNL